MTSSEWPTSAVARWNFKENLKQKVWKRATWTRTFLMLKFGLATLPTALTLADQNRIANLFFCVRRNQFNYSHDIFLNKNRIKSHRECTGAAVSSSFSLFTTPGTGRLIDDGLGWCCWCWRGCCCCAYERGLPLLPELWCVYPKQTFIFDSVWVSGWWCVTVSAIPGQNFRRKCLLPG